jgi:hypothetical protein
MFGRYIARTKFFKTKFFSNMLKVSPDQIKTVV